MAVNLIIHLDRNAVRNILLLLGSASIVVTSGNFATVIAADLEETETVLSVSQLSDVHLTDWSFEALRSLSEEYHCLSGDIDSLDRDQQPLSRLEFAAELNHCLVQIYSQFEESDISPHLDVLQRLQADFSTEILVLREQIDSLEARTNTLEAQQFSTTTKLKGEALFGLSGAFGNERAASSQEATDSPREIDDNIIFSNRIRLFLNTSFTGEDLLRLRLEAGNTPNFSEATDTTMTRIGFDSNTQNNVVIRQLHYRFPVSPSSKAILIAKGTLFDFVDTVNPLLGADSSGSVSAFGLRSPIYREEIGATGAGIDYDITPDINLAIMYLSGNASAPSEGLFDGTYTALGQITLRPTSDLTVGLTYTRSLNAIDIGTSSALASDPFDTASDRIVGNSYGLQASWRMNSSLRLGGWIGLVDVTAQDLENNPSADIFYYAVNVAFPDLGGDGNLAGFVFGQSPKVIRNQFGLEAPDTSLHFEGFYRMQVTENLAITPGIFVITNPEHNAQNNSIVVGTIRTVFSF